MVDVVLETENTKPVALIIFFVTLSAF